MKKRPLISIITVCFNSGKTIERTIKSLKRQTSQNYEYIIIDGGSTDDTVNVISSETAEGFDGRLFFISERDYGIYDDTIDS